jgi:hypothetical protein
VGNRYWCLDDAGVSCVGELGLVVSDLFDILKAGHWPAEKLREVARIMGAIPGLAGVSYGDSQGLPTANVSGND